MNFLPNFDNLKAVKKSLVSNENQSPLRFWGLIVFSLFFSNFLTAQGWMRSFDLVSHDFGKAAIITPDEGYLMVGHSGDGASTDDVLLIKLDIDGEQQWQKTFGGNNYDQIDAILPTNDSHYILIGMTFSFGAGSGDFYMVKTNDRGDEIWAKTFGTVFFEKGISITQTSDGGYALIGYKEYTPENRNIILIKTDAYGEELWQKEYGSGGLDEGWDVVETPDNGLILVGRSETPGTTDSQIYLLKTDANGNFLWMQTHGEAGYDHAFDIQNLPNGGFIIGGVTREENDVFDNYDLFLLKTDSVGNEESFNVYGGEEGEWGGFISQLEDGFAIAGSTWSYGNEQGSDAYLIRTDLDGNELWSKTYGRERIEAVTYITTTPKEEFILVGTSSIQNIQGIIESDAFIVKTQNNGLILTNRVIGKVFYDENLNCEFDAGEKIFPNWVMKVGEENEYLDLTNSTGDYEILIDTGEFQITAFPPNENWQLCENNISFSQNEQYDTTVFHFPAQPQLDCPWLEVDVSTSFLTPCQEAIYQISFCNLGSAAATANLDLKLDEDLLLLSATVPILSFTDQIATFDLGNLEIADCGEFEILVEVNCDALTGKTHKVEAQIYPQEVCPLPSPDWDESSLAASGECLADSLILEIKNIGDGDMGTPQPYIIVEDQIIARADEVLMTAGDSTVIVIYPEGQTVYLEAAQSEHHPGRSFPSLVFEGCGTTGNPSLGIATQFPEDDADYFKSYDYQENISNGGNFQRAYPKGIGSENSIKPNRDIEYHILFQNQTGVTLSNLVLRDTLSPYLNWTTIRKGTSSHPVEMDFSNDGILKFIFDDLNLADGEFGFVKFRLQQNSDNLGGTIITNQISQYPDYQAPNLLNEILHTVQAPFVFDLQNVNLCWSETFDGIPYTEDAVLFSPENYLAADTLATTKISVHPQYEITVDTAVVSGGFYLEAQVFSDTVYVEPQSTSFGCDSIVIHQITIINSVSPNPELVNHLSVSPNPFRENFVLEMNLKKAANANILIMNQLGVVLFRERRFLNGGESRIEVDLKDFSKGVYLLEVEVEGEIFVERVLKM